MSATIKDIIKLQNDFRLTLAEQQRTFLNVRKYGVSKSSIDLTQYHLSLVLNKIVKGNIRKPLTNPVQCPSWISQGDLNSIIALTKRIINEHKF